MMALIGQKVGETGRATKYNADLHCQWIKDLAQKGDFPEAWCAEMAITPNTMRNWVNTHEEFAEAMVIARLLLQTFWTRELARGRNMEGAKPGIYAMLMRRFPELYGKTPIDLFAWLHSQPSIDDATAALTQEAVRAMPDDELNAKIAALQARRAAERE